MHSWETMSGPFSWNQRKKIQSIDTAIAAIVIILYAMAAFYWEMFAIYRFKEVK